MSKNNNQEDRIEMAQELAEVRGTGLVNMMDRKGVIDVLYSMGHDFSAEYLEDNKSDYMELLVLSGQY